MGYVCRPTHVSTLYTKIQLNITQCINKPITVVAGQSCWRSAGCAGFCFRPAITHLIQFIKPNEVIIKCAIAGVEHKSAPYCP